MNTNLWTYMNRNRLYTIKDRFAVKQEVESLLPEVGKEETVEQPEVNPAEPEIRTEDNPPLKAQSTDDQSNYHYLTHWRLSPLSPYQPDYLHRIISIPEKTMRKRIISCCAHLPRFLREILFPTVECISGYL